MKKLRKIITNGCKKYGFALLAVSVLINAIFVLRLVRNKWISYQTNTSQQTDNKAIDDIFSEINPQKGYEINASFGDLGPRMIASGVIDFKKFKANYDRDGQSLPTEDLNILTKGSGQKIKITRDNSAFLLNFFWAVGLANKTTILTQGDMVKYGQNQVGNFASTGGWTLAKSDAMNYFSKDAMIPLTQNQEALVQKVASNIYRPCCDNPTSFPDCNHGMALLGVLEVMAAKGASENQMYDAAKYFNAFWFPSNYSDLAQYFKHKEGKSFKDVPGQVIVSKEYSSASGWQKIKTWLAENGIIEQPSQQGGSCST